MVKCAYKNILETGAVSLAAGAEDPSYPLYRLYDRGVGRAFRAAGTGTLEIAVDQGGAAPLPVDRLIIPSGHNLQGATLAVLCSDDGASYEALAEWTAEYGLINRSWAPASRRYWKLRVTGPSSAPEFSELFFTSTYEWERNPERPAGPMDEAFNVERTQTASGQDRFLVHGRARRRRSYRVSRCGQAQKENIVALFVQWGGFKPLWMEDHEGAWIFGRLASPLNLRETGSQSYGFDFDFVEVLP